MLHRKIVMLVGLVILSLALGAPWAARYFSSPEIFHNTQLLPVPKPLEKIALENDKGELFSTEDFNQHWSLVFFGFTNCFDICPMELQQLSALLKLVPQDQKNRLQVIFISLDPERDTREKIADYLAHFNSHIIGVRGAAVELTNLSHFFAIDYAQTTNSANTYQVEHSGRIFIINPSGQYIGSFSSPQQTENMWADLKILIKRKPNDNQMIILHTLPLL